MTQILDGLVNLLTLERIKENLFRGASQDLGFPQLFGGQVLGQVISAASQTVTPERHVHSLHGYFLRPGDSHQPVVYDVDRVRDGVQSVRRLRHNQAAVLLLGAALAGATLARPRAVVNLGLRVWSGWQVLRRLQPVVRSLRRQLG